MKKLRIMIIDANNIEAQRNDSIVLGLPFHIPILIFTPGSG